VPAKQNNTNQRLLGAHVSTAGGLLKTLERAKILGCNCVQIFAGNPRGWKGTPVSTAEAEAYQAAAPEFGVQELIIHAIYLVNLASPKKEVYQKSLVSLRNDLISAGRLGVRNVVVHPGSDLGDGQGETRLRKALQSLQKDIPAGCRLLLEGMAGTKNSLGDLQTLGRLCQDLGKQVGICLDSAHLCASGYDLAKAEEFKRFIRDIKKYIGYEKIGCIHLNDSRQACGSHRDQHENLGEGYVGRTGLCRLLQHKPFWHLPFILETPGFNELGPDRKNMQRLRRYAASGI